MAGLVNGTDLNLYVLRTPLGYIPIGNALNFEFDAVAEQIDQTNKSSQGFKEIMLGSKSYTISVDQFYENFKFGGFMDMFSNLKNGLEVSYEFKVIGSGSLGKKYIGRGYIISMVAKGETEVGSEYKLVISGHTLYEALN